VENTSPPSKWVYIFGWILCDSQAVFRTGRGTMFRNSHVRKRAVRGSERACLVPFLSGIDLVATFVHVVSPN
jgi:hypothetical protein